MTRRVHTEKVEPNDIARPESIFSKPLSNKYAQAPQLVQEELPPNVLWRIVGLVGSKELKSLHRVNRAWRDAVCQGLGTVVARKGSLTLMPRFPNVEPLTFK